jgi:hypothetical protein
MGVSGEGLIQALMVLSPEIYGKLTDPEKIELDGLLYVMERLPKGIEECRFVRLISREGYETSHLTPIVPARRKRNCYRLDEQIMYVEMTRGRSDIYDILTHEETFHAVQKFAESSNSNSLFSIVYHLGKLSMEESNQGLDREISFSATLRERVGHHVYGELWANRIKEALLDRNLIHRPIHIISANMHSVLNTIYAHQALGANSFEEIEEHATAISIKSKNNQGKKILAYAEKQGFIDLPDESGTNIGAQLIDTAQMDVDTLIPGVVLPKEKEKRPVFVVMDYAFGEQAYECFDELLKPYSKEGKKYPLNVVSTSIMGKAGILHGGKGDLMVPNSHVFEGTADNYPFRNELKVSDFKGYGLGVYSGSMITVLGTSLQNRDILTYFMESSWKAVGLEMEGAHYQKAIQSASKIRSNVRSNIKVLYAYYASDNPLETGSTLASGALGMDGVRPTYLITYKILEKLFAK